MLDFSTRNKVLALFAPYVAARKVLRTKADLPYYSFPLQGDFREVYGAQMGISGLDFLGR